MVRKDAPRASRLTAPRAEIAKAVKSRIREANRIIQMPTRSASNKYEAIEAYKTWESVCSEMLAQAFETMDERESFLAAPDLPTDAAMALMSDPDAATELQGSWMQLGDQTAWLERLIKRLPLIPEPSAPGPAQRPAAQPAYSKSQVFVVHGHDQALTAQVKALLLQLGLDPIILAEQTNEGKHVMEKLEAHSGVGFAVVLLTPDDVGRAGKEEKLRARARQNVILELGYFMAKIGRARVAALCAEGVEQPSDYRGIVYIAVDGGRAWAYQLGRELKKAGFDVDLNRIT